MKRYTKAICTVLLLGMSVNAWGAAIDKTQYSVSIDAINYGTFYTADFVGEDAIEEEVSIKIVIKAGYPGAVYAYLGSGSDYYISDGTNNRYVGTSAGEYTIKVSTYFNVNTADSYNDVLYISFANPNVTEEIPVSAIVAAGSRPSYTVSFSVGFGSIPSPITNSSITLPTIPAVCDDAEDAGWIPCGWSTLSVAANSSSASIVGEPGDTYYPDADRTLYAVYIKPGTSLASTTTFSLVSSGRSTSAMPTSGYIIMTEVNQTKSAISNTIYTTYISEVGNGDNKPTINKSDGIETANACIVWEVASPSSGVYTFRNLANGKYLGLANSNGSTAAGVLLDNATTDYAKWTVPEASDNGFYLKNKGQNTYYLRWTDGSGWRGADSKNGTQDNIYIRRYTSALAAPDSKFQSSLPMCGYQVTYHPNTATSGSVPTDNTIYTSGQTVTVKGNTGSLAKTGYTFSGWNTLANGTGTNYTAGTGTFSITSDITLYAKWVAKEYTVNLDKDGGSGGSTSVTATYNAAMPSAGVAPTFSGYSFGGYYASQGGSGTQYYNATPASAHVWDVDVDPSTIYAKWSQTVRLDKNTGSANGSADVIYHKAGTTNFSRVTKTGYTCTGYWDATSGGHKVLNADGTLVSYSTDVSGYINSSGQWIHAGATTLYAQWEAKEYTITLNQNGGSDGAGSVTVTFGEGMPSATMPTAPTGYTFAGYFYEETKYYNADGSSAHEWNIDDNVTLVASYTTNTPDLTVSSTDYVTITATPSGGSTIAEGSHNTVAYNTTITIANSDLESGYYWAGWDVYETGNSSNKVAVSSNSFAMPNHNVTVSAIVYPEGNIKAWCPVISLEPTDGVVSPILVTSVSGQTIKAVRTLHLTVTGAATPAAVVTISGTDLEFYKTDGTKITNSNLTCSSYALDETIVVAYAPSSYVDESWAAPAITVSCSGTDVVVSDLVNARCLPDNGTGSGQGFVIAAKVDGEWLALPSAMSAGAQDGLPITVDYDEDPTEATLAPTSARYNLYNVYTSSGVNDRHKVYGDYAYLAGSGSKVLKAASSGTNISLGVNASTYSGGSADAAYFEWLLSTTDKKNYTLTNNGRSAQLKYYTTHDKFGMYTYSSQVITEFRLLPATFYEEAPMQVVEWKANSIVVMYTGSETTATTKVGNNDPSSSQALASRKLTHGIYELSTNEALTANDGASLEISFGDGSTRKIVEIPIIITGNANAAEGHADQDVVICNGGKLTASATNYDYYNVYVYGGGKLSIPDGTSLGVNNIILRAGGVSTNGSGGSAAYAYEYPQVSLIGTLSSAEENIHYEYITDYDHWYHLVLPFDGTLSSIHYPHEYYGDNVNEENTGSWVIKRYAGEIRATGNYDAWIDIETESATVATAGHGYIYWGAPKKITIGGDKQRQAWGIQRITMPITATDAKTAENSNKVVDGLGSYSSVGGNSGQDNDQGWNLIGNPYMANLTDMNNTGIHAGKLVEVLDANDNWTGRWKWNDETSVRYLTIPDHNFYNYAAKTISVAAGAGDLNTGHTFFVQIDGEATAVTFQYEHRASLLPALYAATEVDVETGIVMSDESHSDEVNFWIKEGKTAEYEKNADYPKTPNTSNFNIYGVHSHGNLSWIAISPEIAEGDMAIGYQVPAAGDYALSLTETYPSTDVDALFVTDHEVNPEITTNLVEESYIFHVNQAETNNTRFTVSIKLKTPNPDDPDSPGTGIDRTQKEGEKPIKFLYRDKMYIMRNGVIYDATGKKVREINK
ncbi:MAG: InlB B-repeat-containing protein [Paludibacteraceae bacterium]|nr:InlB B-repeat-containing protein [Paludibacteraceae bacterium]